MIKIKKKRVQSSHLALRFYKQDGWTKEILDRYLIRGRVLDVWADQPVRDYWFLDRASQFDIERLYENEVSEVVRWYAPESDTARREAHKTDVDYMKEFNG